MIVHQVPFPEGFRGYGGTQPDPVTSADGYWFYAVYGKAQGEDTYTQHVIKWRPVEPYSIDVPLEKRCTGRGSLGRGDMRLWLSAWHEGALYMQEVPGWVPTEY